MTGGFLLYRVTHIGCCDEMIPTDIWTVVMLNLVQVRSSFTGKETANSFKDRSVSNGLAEVHHSDFLHCPPLPPYLEASTWWEADLSLGISRSLGTSCPQVRRCLGFWSLPIMQTRSYSATSYCKDLNCLKSTMGRTDKTTNPLPDPQPGHMFFVKFMSILARWSKHSEQTLITDQLID